MPRLAIEHREAYTTGTINLGVTEVVMGTQYLIQCNKTKEFFSSFGYRDRPPLCIPVLFGAKEFDSKEEAFKFINEYLEAEFKLNEEEKSFDKFISFLTSNSKYERIKGQLEETDITIERIESIEIKQDEDVLEVQKDEDEQNEE